MGCCPSKSANTKASQISRWRATGIVALRDAKLKSKFLAHGGGEDEVGLCTGSHVRYFSRVDVREAGDGSDCHPVLVKILKALPHGVLDLGSTVRTLDVTHNKLVNIPIEINKLINLQRLVLSDNLIEELPMNLWKLQSLKAMTLDGNRITSLPDELGQLVRLERLSISGNVLTSLPQTIGSLRNLLLLDVSNNKLKYLPESVGSCFSLEELQANDNLIEDLPSSVCNLIHLKSLCLNNNKLSQIPPNILKDCKALQNISLHDNPISMDRFQQMEGFPEFESRRKKKFDKQIDSNVMIGSKGLDEGVDL